MPPYGKGLIPTLESVTQQTPRHSMLVRISHWIDAAAFIVFVLSGSAILVAYPRVHGGSWRARHACRDQSAPAFLLELNIRVSGRYLHFLTAWVSLFNGLIYLIAGSLTRHFWNDTVPS